MYKPHTIKQFKVWLFLNENFMLDHFLLSPVSPTALMIEDKAGERLVFAWADGTVVEQPEPIPSDPETVKAFIRAFRENPEHPRLHTFEDVTRWWLSHATPLTYQQALNLSDMLYRHFLAHKDYDEEEVLHLIEKGVVTEEEYCGIKLWYLNGNTKGKWLGPLGVDGTGNLYGLTLHYGSPIQTEYTFYINDDYYRYMNRNR